MRTNQYENSIRYGGGGAALQQSFTVRDAVFGRTTAEAMARNTLSLAQNNTIRPLANDLKSPYDLNGSLTVEQQLPKGVAGTFTYNFSRGINQFRTRNINAPQFINGVLTPRNPALGVVLQTESSALNENNRFIFQLNRRMGKVMAFGSYTLGWSKSNGDGTPADSFNLLSEWGRSSFDRRHNFSVGSFVTLPKNFRLNFTAFASSGSPFNITTGSDDNRDGLVSDRPLDVNGNPLQRNANLPASFYVSRSFDREICPPGASCTDPNDPKKRINLVTLRKYMQDNFPNGVRAQSPGVFDVSASLNKTIGFGKPKNNVAQTSGQPGGGDRGGRGGGPGGGGGGRGGGGGPGGGGGGGGPMMMGMGGGSETSRYTLTFSVNASNIFNRVNYGGYSGTLGSSFFGRSSGANSARQLDFGVRFGF